jgi:hypothetical protein
LLNVGTKPNKSISINEMSEDQLDEGTDPLLHNATQPTENRHFKKKKKPNPLPELYLKEEIFGEPEKCEN